MEYICNCKTTNFLSKDFTYWEDRNTTTDELDIIKNIEETKSIKTKSNILHIGIGNSFLAKKFSEKYLITGLTVSKKEIKKAKTLNLSNYEVFLCDKYSKNFELNFKNKKFDLIIDTNLKSYACCQKSFDYFMKNLISILKIDGLIITSINGMNWVKKLKPKLSFNFKKLFYFKLKEVEGSIENKLSIEEINKLSKKLNFKFSYDDKLCYLVK